MATPKETRRYFIAKHGLDAFERLPQFIWRTGLGPNTIPRAFSRVRLGDRWIAFAYTTSDERERPLSLITGFYECTRTAYFGPIPLTTKMRRKYADGATEAWMIEGKTYRETLRGPVGVPPVDDLLDRRTFKQSTLTPITASEFERIRTQTLRLQIDMKELPLLRREPRNEQELLSIVVSCHKAIGIRRFVRVQTAFPDLCVELAGRAEDVHLELEVYSGSFLAHGHHRQVARHRVNGDGKPVAVLCWIDNDRHGDIGRYVHKVFELRSLLLGHQKMRW